MPEPDPTAEPFTLSAKPTDLDPAAAIRWHYAEGDAAPAGSAARRNHYRIAARLAAEAAQNKKRRGAKRKDRVKHG